MDGIVEIIDSVFGDDGSVGMTGDSFGGCVVTLGSTAMAEQVKDVVSSRYEKELGLTSCVYL